MTTLNSTPTRRHLGALLALIGLLICMLTLVGPAHALSGSSDLPSGPKIIEVELPPPAPAPRAAAMPKASAKPAATVAAKPAPATVTPAATPAATAPAKPAKAAAASKATAQNAGAPKATPPKSAAAAAPKQTARASDPGDARVSPPTAVSVEPLGERKIAISWAAPRGAVASYEVTRTGAAPIVTKAVRAVEAGLRPGTLYCYGVSAVDGAGRRSPRSHLACARTPDLVAPTTPSHLTATLERPQGVALAWDASHDDSGQVWYEVIDKGVVLATVETTSWMHADAEHCEHRYSVRAVDAAGNRSGESGAGYLSLRDVDPPSVPSGLRTKPVSPTHVALEWTAATDDVGVDHYEVLIGRKVLVRTDTTFAMLYRGRELQEYCVSVRAIDTAGNASAPSKPMCGIADGALAHAASSDLQRPVAQ